MRPRGPRWRAATVAAAVFCAVVGSTAVGSTVPARAAELGAAKLLAGNPGQVTGSAGVCSLWSSASGNYGLRCAGGGTGRDYRELLAGAPVPTCWLLPVGYEHDLTPGSAAPFALGRVDSFGVTPGPTGAPTGTPTQGPAPVGEDPGPEDPGPETSGPENPEPENPEPESPQPESPEPVPVELPEDFLTVCVTGGVEAATARPGPDADLSWAPVSLLRSSPDRPPFWWELTTGQRRWATRMDGAGRIDWGTLVTSPSTAPRIGQVVAFSTLGAGSTPAVVGDSRMQAFLLGLRVRTGEPGRPEVLCTGPGRALEPGATERTGEDVCSFAYGQTSGGRGTLAPDTFDVVGTELWEIRFSGDAGRTWERHRSIEREVRIGLRVTEVQTLVVPIAP